MSKRSMISIDSKLHAKIKEIAEKNKRTIAGQVEYWLELHSKRATIIKQDSSCS